MPDTLIVFCSTLVSLTTLSALGTEGDAHNFCSYILYPYLITITAMHRTLASGDKRGKCNFNLMSF